MPDGEILSMGCGTLNRVRPAHNRGMQLLFRMSVWHNPYLGEGCKVARAQQVYRIINTGTVWVSSASSGW